MIDNFLPTAAALIESVSLKVSANGTFEFLHKEVIYFAQNVERFSLRCRAIGAPESLLVWRCATATDNTEVVTPVNCKELSANITDHVRLAEISNQNSICYQRTPQLSSPSLEINLSPQ